MEKMECKILYDYTKQEPNELNIVKGDIVTDIDKVAGEWWKVTLKKTGERGLIPSNYVEVVKSHNLEDHHDELNLSENICKFPSEIVTFETFISRGWKESLWFRGTIVDQEFGVIPIALKTWGKRDFLHEKYFLEKAKIISQVNHENIVKFMGLCLSHHPACVVVELFSEGNLLTYLHEANHPSSKDIPALSSCDLIQIAIDVALGCQYLQQQQIIHLQIMAQNCYIVKRPGGSRSIKIGGFDFAVKMIDDASKDYNPRQHPVRWSAPELFSALSIPITTEADKWSYGIVLHETFSFGAFPYPGMQNSEVISYVAGGGRMRKPVNCSDDIYEIMRHCWELLPDKRISYESILSILHRYLEELNQQEQIALAANKKSSFKTGLKRIFQKSASKTSNRSVDDQSSGAPDFDIICTKLIDKYHEDIPECDDYFTFYEDSNENEVRIRKVSLANLQILGFTAIGSTNHATYHEGILTKDFSSNQSILVTVKTLKAANVVSLAEFLSEAKTICDFNHKNIIKFIGVCLERDPVCTVMERFYEKDSLLTILRANHSSIDQQQANLFNFSLRNFIQIAIDIAEACLYLQYQRVIHTYIGACNCYLFRNQPIDKQFTTKLGGFDDALTLPLQDDYYIVPEDTDCPYLVKWTPPEVFTESKYFLESDIWSYGIMLWELFSDGSIPYPGMTNAQIKEFISGGDRMSKPFECPQEIYFSVMKACWLKSPTGRIKFDKIAKSLREHMANILELEESLSNEKEPPPPAAEPISPFESPIPSDNSSLYLYEEFEQEEQITGQSKNENKAQDNENGDIPTLHMKIAKEILEEVPEIEKKKTVKEDTDNDPTMKHREEQNSASTELIIIKKKQIGARLSLAKNHKARGIIFIVGVYGADGTEIDVENIEITFKELNFVTYIVQDPPADEISAIIQAAADVQLYPYKYEYVAFYFAGHGGRDEEGKMFIVGLQKDDERKEILYVDDHIINPLKCLHERKLSRLFFFDCCQSKGEGTAYRSDLALIRKKPKPHPGEIIAYATNDGEKSWGDRENGGIWTYHLCKNIRELDEPITTILSKTYDDVVEARDSFQQPLVVASLGMRKLKNNIAKPAPVMESIDSSTGSLKDDAIQLKKEKNNNNDEIYKKPITVQAVCSALKKYSSLWNDFACELEVDDTYRDVLENDDSLSDEEKLAKIITQWIEKRTCEVSWNRIVAVNKELELETEKLEKAAGNICLMKSDDWREVFNCLKRNASCWSDLAQELNISDSFRDELERSITGNDRRKLEKVIKEWLDESKGYEPTWEKMIEAVKELDLTEELQKLEIVAASNSKEPLH